MAEARGISPSSVGHIRAQAGLKPHITKGLKISNARWSVTAPLGFQLPTSPIALGFAAM